MSRLRRARVGLIALTFGCALAAACFDFDATENGALVDGGADGTAHGEGGEKGGPDGTTGSGDAGTDAPAEAGTDSSSDAPAHTDAPPDGATGFCGSFVPSAWAAFFCADFDEGPLPGGWKTFDETAGSLTETDASWVSAPSSLEETTNALGSFQPIDVALRTPLALPPVPSTLDLGFSFEPVTLDTSASATIVLASIDFLDASQERYSVELSLTVVNGAATLALGEQSMLSDGAAPYVYHPLPPSQPVPAGSFSDIVIEVEWATATTATGIVRVGGGQELSTPLTMTVVPESLQVGVGTSYVTEPSLGWKLRYDDVYFTAK